MAIASEVRDSRGIGCDPPTSRQQLSIRYSAVLTDPDTKVNRDLLIEYFVITKTRVATFVYSELKIKGGEPLRTLVCGET
jgi:hypothetical protein